MRVGLRRTAANPRRILAILIGLVALVMTSVGTASINPPTRAERGDPPVHTAGRARAARRRSKHARGHASAGHALKMIWGPLTMPNGSSAFPVYHRLGVQVLELQLIWGRVAPTRPSEPANPADPAYL